MYELNLDYYLSKPQQRNKLNGQFIKGHVPHNKGKKMEEWIPKEKIDKVLSNLVHKGNPGIAGFAGSCKRKVVRIDNDGKFVVYESAKAAAEYNNCQQGNITLCCQKKRKKCGGYRWFYENDKRWTELIQC